MNLLPTSPGLVTISNLVPNQRFTIVPQPGATKPSPLARGCLPGMINIFRFPHPQIYSILGTSSWRIAMQEMPIEEKRERKNEYYNGSTDIPSIIRSTNDKSFRISIFFTPFLRSFPSRRGPIGRKAIHLHGGLVRESVALRLDKPTERIIEDSAGPRQPANHATARPPLRKTPGE